MSASERRRPRVLVMNQYYAPGLEATAQLLRDLCVALTDDFDLALASNGDKGQSVTVTATPNDGTADGTAATASATVANSAPAIDSASVAQPAPKTNDILTATATKADADNDAVTLTYLNSILSFAEANHIRARMHNLIWGDDSTNEEQPSWVVNLLANPNATDPVSGTLLKNAKSW